ncbi:MAG: bacterial Ig-like domain-containing protein, partial [Firmicutes bacterium]|nr:bacterial Ig-like domain-containing protein [Bacillota bacterium]
MKKNRMIAWTLATSMMVSSLSTSSFAQDFSSSVEPTAESVVESDANDEEVDVLADEVVSDAAVDVTGAELVPMATADYTSGTYNNKNFDITITDDGANMLTTMNTAGKYADNEYNLGYVARKNVTADTDFVFSGKVTVNSFTAGSSHHQKAFGIMLANSLSYENAKTFKHAAAYVTGKASSDSANNVLRVATDVDGKRTVAETLATDFEVRGGDTYDFKMQKAGNAIEFTVNGQTSSVMVDDGYFSGDVYPMFFIARSANIEVSNVVYEEKAAVKSIEITKLPAKTEYYTSQALDTTGLEVTATLADGSKKVLSEDDYILSGFDSSKLGTSTVTVSAGKGSASFDTKIRNIEVSKITITQKPYKDEFFYGTKFKTDGLVADVTLEDGTTTSYKNTSKEDDDSLSLIYYIGGTEYKAGDILPKSLQGTQTVKVFRKDTDSITGGDVYGEYTIEVSQANLSKIDVYRNPNTTTYYYGNEFDPTGLIVAAYYQDEDGNENYDFLTENEYTITGYNATSTTYGKQTLTITSTFDPTKTATLTVDYVESREMSMDISKYPRLTFDVGEDFDKEGLEVKVSMNDGKSKVVAEGEYYSIDLSQYDNTKAGTTKVVIKSLKDNLQSITLDVTIQEAVKNVWRATVFGQSASGAGVGAGPSTVTVTPSENYGTVDEGTVVNTRSWNGAGKIATDQDGICYYYTRVSTDKNVTLSADMEIVGYMENYYEDRYDVYGNFIPDAGRSGQEAVGLMLRDVIPFKAQAEYADDNGITIFPSQAVLDDEGEPVPYNVVTENPDTDPTFASNMAQAATMAPNAFPSDPTASSYAKNITTNRVSLIMRTGVTSYVSAGANANKSQYATLTDHVPKAGEKYRITLQRANGGVRLECTDYQSGETTEYYQDVDDLVTLQDPENMYIGFFAARWGEANFSNIDFHVTDPATDPIYPVPAKALTNPSVTVQSTKNTTAQNYNLMLKPNHDSGGYVMIKLNDKIVYNNALLSRKGTTYPVELVPDSVNNFTVIYSPNASDEITSTKDVVTTFTVTHKSNYDSSAKFLYAGPKGTPAGSGTKDDPMDVYSALGFIEPGQTIYLLGGTYNLPEPIDIPITNFGYQTEGKGKAMIADPEATERPFFNFEDATGDEGMKVTGNYWTLKGFDITAPAPNMKGFSLGGSHCLVEDVKTIGCGTTGFQISRTYSTNDFSLWPSYNTIKNCESYNSADASKQNADGFGCKLTVGLGNVFDGCVSHHNSDDGWDLYTKLGTGAIGPVKLQNCISYMQGYELVDGE